MTGSRQFAVERAARRRQAAKEERASVEVRDAVVWYSRTRGTQDAPWLVTGMGGITYRAEQVTFSGPTRTLLLSEELRELYPDKPRGVLEASLARLYGAEELARE